MTMMMILLLLPLCLMHLKEVAGTITLTTDNSLVKIGDEVAMTCMDTEEVAIEIYFAKQPIGNCNLFGGTICSVFEQTLYSVSIDESPAGYNLITFTIKSFAVSNCGEYTCFKKSDPRVKDTTTVEHKLSYGDSCGTCGQCSPSTSMSCYGRSTCNCNKGYTYKDNVCIIDQRLEYALGDTAIISCNIPGQFSNPRWDDGSHNVYIAEGQTTFNNETTNSRWSRSEDTKTLIITSIEDSDPRTYRCSITTPTTDSYIAIVTVIIDPPECECDCDRQTIVWLVFSWILSFSAFYWTIFVVLAGKKADCESPCHAMSEASIELKDANHKAMDSNRSDTVSRTYIFPDINETVSKKPLSFVRGKEKEKEEEKEQGRERTREASGDHDGSHLFEK
ncbi:uncharacterized protein LOC128236038 [Mya arenaria]|uniref:uncharacterized protein LOC128236038 n=1 Tax=Mya arenaria TaxID=6604 RepID=UPI0022E17BF1|nr:uncharacterized protein LOC128236038 [Mya arenaria]